MILLLFYQRYKNLSIIWIIQYPYQRVPSTNSKSFFLRIHAQIDPFSFKTAGKL